MKNIIVIKIGGSCIQHQEQLESLIKAVAKLVSKKIKFVIVHGGGVQADLLNQKLGIPIKKVNGRRITDSQTLSTVKMVYKGLLNTDLVSLCQKFKIPAVGFSGVDGKIAEVIKRPLVGNIDFGFVGDIKKINIDLICILLVKKYVPVITCLGINNDGQVFNINADTLATQIALKLKANKLIFITDVEGITENKNSKYAKYLSVNKAKELINKGIITKGMIPKIENIEDAISDGIKKVLVVGGLQSQSQWINAFQKNKHGTLIVPHY
ncbi:MAG: Acetylglutamate kinase [Candidatus Roizmanbacteria bacterium GW2011_GWA2_32_13]|uniref:Acetylglutamate kinase n=1 Tax=Candidatus Roizmanbacteria bacterium GW2011_GWA2_32_13 TaxID=1618475 RepID=A0A0F9Z1Y7_9BACT|nr:MAG: Acetylglutamate kinase [Candidatus Roizmanbacteria bacterium GW2011_GWA2_32_13]